MKNKLIIFSGSSGVGKGTILARLFADPALKLKYSISLTTRPPREHEVHGQHYFFVSHEAFDQAIANGDLLEWNEFIGNKYGTQKQFIQNTLKEGYSPLLEIEVNGAQNVMKNYDGEYISIFIAPPSMEELKRRLSSRNTETPAQIEKRMQEAIHEMSCQDKYQYVIVNDDIDRCVEEIKVILKNA